MSVWMILVWWWFGYNTWDGIDDTPLPYIKSSSSDGLADSALSTVLANRGWPYQGDGRTAARRTRV